MQILTENQQVSVRITTEFPAVRDMIEAGLQQLKSDLQNQGLHVDRLEVSVSDDPHKQPRRHAKPDGSSRSGAAEGVFSADRRAAENRLEPVYYRARPAGAATIDMFA
jgi:flagellar hook-length control protein FliK